MDNKTTNTCDEFPEQLSRIPDEAINTFIKLHPLVC